MIVLQGLVILVVILAAFAVLSAITAVIERLPNFPPTYTDDPLPPPNPRSVVRQRWNVPN